MRKLVLFLDFILITSILSASSLEIKVKLLQEEILSGMPVWFEVELKNTSPLSIEVPKLENVSIGENGLCRNILLKKNGEMPTRGEFKKNIVLNDRFKSPLPTEILQPSEGRKIIFQLGYAVKPMDLRFSIECEFYEDLKEYEKHHYLLDHPIHSGVYASNEVSLKVKQPTGVDLEVFNEYLKGRSLWVLRGLKTKIFEILKTCPESIYAEQLAIEYFAFTAYKNSFKPNSDEKESCKYAKERSRAYLQNEAHYKTYLEGQKKKKKEIDALESVVLSHQNSQFIIPLAYQLALKYMNYEDYRKARHYWQLISTSKPKKSQDKALIVSAKTFLDCMNDFGIR